MVRRNRQVILKREIASINRRMTGHRLVPRGDPPAFVQRPWNQWTFERSNDAEEAAEDTISTGDVIGQIVANCGLDTTAQVEIKCLNAYSWYSINVDGGSASRPILDTEYYEGSISSSGVSAVRLDARDVGTLTGFARTGYEWPINEQRNIFVKGATDTPLVRNLCVTGPGQLTVRIHVLWRSRNTS